MKIGFSFGRCIRDIVNGDVELEDVAFIIAATCMHDEKHVRNVILNYLTEPSYLLGYNEKDCMEVGLALWNQNKVLQPRKQGIPRHAQPENAVWVDIFPTSHSDSEAVKTAWDQYRFMLHMVENVDTEAIDVFKEPY
jgi:hypothetical protein